MKQEWITVQAQTVAEAVEKAAEELGVSEKELTYEIEKEGKKTLFGKVKEEAQIKAKILIKEGKKTLPEEGNDTGKVEIAKSYLGKLLEGLGIENWEIKENLDGDKYHLNIQGEQIQRAIGRRGETLDAIQYLVCLAANHGSKEYLRFIIDSGDFRDKREETLKRVAEKAAKKALRNGRSVTLEPMNPYERRIIHSAIAEMEKVSSKSKGDEPRRRIVIFEEGNKARRETTSKKRDYTAEGNRPSSQPTTYNFEKDFLRQNKNTGMYSKIEIESPEE